MSQKIKKKIKSFLYIVKLDERKMFVVYRLGRKND